MRLPTHSRSCRETNRPGREFLRSLTCGRGDTVSSRDETVLGIAGDRLPSRAMARIALPDAPALVAGHGRAAIFTADGELLLLPAAEAASRLRSLPPPILVHAPSAFRRLGVRGMPAFDLLELFAFALPGRAAAPTPRGLALALDFPPPIGGLEAEAALLPELASVLLNRLVLGRDTALNRDAAGLAARMGQAGWGW